MENIVLSVMPSLFVLYSLQMSHHSSQALYDITKFPGSFVKKKKSLSSYGYLQLTIFPKYRSVKREKKQPFEDTCEVYAIH